MNSLCFIGRNLNCAELEEQLKACIFNGQFPEPGRVPNDPLRIKVGEQVLCNVCTWEPSVMVKHYYHEVSLETGKYVPFVSSTGQVD